MAVTEAVFDIAFRVPFLLEKRVKLIVLDIDDDLFRGVILINKAADGTH